MNLNTSIPAHESRHLVLLGSLLLAVPLVWLLLLGWHPSELIPQQDHAQLGIIYMRELSRAAGDWHSLLYWPGLGGGVKVHDVTGSLPIAQLLAWLGSPALIMANLQVMFIQVIFAYLCVTCTRGLLRVIYNNFTVTSWQLDVPAGLLFAFLPIISWRVTHGHDSIVIGLYVLLGFSVLFLDEMARRRSVVTILVVLLALCHTFQFNGFQMVHYGILFGGPIVLGLMFAKPGIPFTARLGWYLLPVLVFLAAFLISLPKFYGILLNGFGDDSARVAGDFDVIYSYTVAELADWLSSLPWAADYIPEARQQFTHHEVNYPVGPIVLLVLLGLAGSHLLRFSIGLAVSLVMALIVSMNIEPLSTVFVSTVPLLDSFRVPARSVLPVVVFVSMLAVAALIDRSSRAEQAKATADLEREENPEGAESASIEAWQIPLAAGGAFAAFSFSPPFINDVVLVAVVVALLVLREKTPVVAYTMVLALFAGGALAAFKQRAYEPLANPITDAGITAVRENIFRQAPELRSPLYRAQVNVQNQSIGINTGFFLDVSNLSSYWFPLSRYARLRAALEGTPYHPTLSVFFHLPDARAYEPMNRLYNVTRILNPGPRGVAVGRGGEAFGPAWISHSLEWHDSWESLADGLRVLDDREQLLLLKEDPRIEFAGEDSSRCSIKTQASTFSVRFPFEFQLAVEGRCYLTIAMNYTSIMRAVDQSGRRLETFPAYGALMAVVVDNETKTVSIEPTVSTFPGAFMIQLLGFILAIVLVMFVSLRGDDSSEEPGAV